MSAKNGYAFVKVLSIGPRNENLTSNLVKIGARKSFARLAASGFSRISVFEIVLLIYGNIQLRTLPIFKKSSLVIFSFFKLW
jgi:hypothetical protein